MRVFKKHLEILAALAKETRCIVTHNSLLLGHLKKGPLSCLVLHQVPDSDTDILRVHFAKIRGAAYSCIECDHVNVQT